MRRCESRWCAGSPLTLSAVHPARRIVFMKGAQVGATEAGNNWLGYVLHHVPAPVLAVQPTVELAKRFSRQRIDPLLEETPALRDRVAAIAIAIR
ncbi:MAG: phage terminase large subunit family protein [Acetobacteraceae bacterium]